ncbi:glycosyltransferase family 2 protein [uncultured Bacteroides sp.]|nr:glycosyltransferase family 2 protein [uncultured Bacteroides sp.]
MAKCIVSIIIPIFNRKELVSSMINSVINQTFQNWELLLIDDGSTEDTLEMLHQFTIVDKRIYLYKRDKHPKGAPVCRNIGLSYAKGKYVIFFDSDDLIPDYNIQQRVDFMERNKDLDFAVFPAMSFTGKIGEGENDYVGIKTEGDDLKHLIDCNLPFLVVTNIYRITSLVEKGIMWDEHLLSLQDADFNIRNMINGNKYDYAYDARIDYYIRIIPHSNSISQSIYNVSHYDSHLYFIHKILKELPIGWKIENKWSIRRRIVYIYTLLGEDSNEHLQQLKNMILMEDNVFYPLFCLSVKLYAFLRKYSCPKSIYWAFPYYSLYKKMHDISRRKRIAKLLKKGLLKNE